MNCSPLAGRIFDSANARIRPAMPRLLRRDVRRVSIFTAQNVQTEAWTGVQVPEKRRRIDAVASATHPTVPYCYPEVAAKEREFTAPPE